jgi:hypothetical protein
MNNGTLFKCESDLKDIDILERIGSPSLYGQVFKACFRGSCSYVFKKIRLNKDDIDILYYYYCQDRGIKDCDRNKIDRNEVIKYHDDFRVMRQSIWTELLVLNLCNILLDQEICFNLPRTYGYYFCNNCDFLNDDKKVVKYPCTLLVTELADEDLYSWLKTERATLELNVMFFQIFAGLYSLRKYFNIIHNDLHAGNILVKKIPKNKGEYMTYTIDGVDYHIPNIGYIFIIWDFGYGKIPNKVKEIKKFKEYYKEQEKKGYDVVDYTRISKIVGSIVKNKEIKEIVKYILKCGKEKIPLQELITIFVNFKNPLNKQILKCSFDKQIILPEKYSLLANDMMVYNVKPPTEPIEAIPYELLQGFNTNDFSKNQRA